jgi:PAS domain S-box-containing protein
LSSTKPSAELVASFALLDALVSDAPVGLGFWDTDLRYRRVNTWLANAAGVAAEAHIGRRLPEMLGSLGARLEDCLRQVLQAGEPMVERELTGVLPTSAGSTRHWRVSLYPIDATDQTELGVGATIIDVTAERRAAEAQRRAADDERREHVRENAVRAEVLARASAALSASLEVESVLDALVSAVVPELADWCTIHVPEPAGGLRLLAVAHRDRDRRRLAWELARRHPPGSAELGGVAAVIRSGRREVHTEIAGALAGSEERRGQPLRGMRELGLSSSVVLPLLARGQVLGALTLAMGDSGRHYSGETLDLAESVAAQAAAALDNARLYAEQASIAHTLQQSLLPLELPHIPGLDVAACYRPRGPIAEVGGDFYDVFADGDGNWRFLIGDVVGKGAEAAALTAVARYTLRGAELSGAPLAAKLGCVNEALCHRSSGVEFCSAVYGTVDVSSQRMRPTSRSSPAGTRPR